MLKDIVPILEAQDVVWLVGVISAALATVVQKMSKKYKPWSWLAQRFGKAVNKEMLDKLDSLEQKVDQLEKKDNEQDAQRQRSDALAARRRILRFADEVRRHDKHSEEYFNNVLEDISDYKTYCNEHPNFENEKAVIAIRIIEKAYEHCVEEDDFL